MNTCQQEINKANTHLLMLQLHAFLLLHQQLLRHSGRLFLGVPVHLHKLGECMLLLPVSLLQLQQNIANSVVARAHGCFALLKFAHGLQRDLTKDIKTQL